MGEGLVILGSALRHGVSEADMLHAYEFALYHMDGGDGVTMYVGPTRSGDPLLEIGVATRWGMRVIIHAMPLRNRYTR